MALVLDQTMHEEGGAVHPGGALAELLFINMHKQFNILVRHVAWGGPRMVVMTHKDKHSRVLLNWMVLGVFRGLVLPVGGMDNGNDDAPTGGSNLI